MHELIYDVIFLKIDSHAPKQHMLISLIIMIMPAADASVLVIISTLTV